MGSLRIRNKFSYLPLTLLLLTVPVSTTTADDITSQVKEIERLVQDDNLQQALSSSESLLEKSPDNPTLRFVHATILEKTGDSDKAKAIYEDLTSNENAYPEAFNNLALIYARSGDFKSAITTLESAFRTHRGYATVYANLKAIYDKLASDAYKIALDLDSPPIKLKLIALDQVTDIASDSGQIPVTKPQTPKPIQNDTGESTVEADSSAQIIPEPVTESEPPPVSIIEQQSAVVEEKIESINDE